MFDSRKLLPLSKTKLDMALTDHQLADELDERDVRIRLLAIEKGMEYLSARIRRLEKGGAQ